MNVDPQKFLANNKVQIIFDVHPKNDSQESKLDWLEAFKDINNGAFKEKLDQDITWADKYKKIITFRDKCLKICAEIPSEDLDKTVKFVTLFSELSKELVEIKNIFSKTVPLTQENVLKDIYFNSKEKLFNFFNKIASKLNIECESKDLTSIDDTDTKSKNSFNTKAIEIDVFKHYCEKYRFKDSSWNPKQDITNLIKELKTHGPLLISGSFGQDFYSKPSRLLDHKLGEEKKPVWGWDTEPNIFTSSFSNPKSIGKEANKVLLIGAQKSKNSTGHVYFVSSNEQKIFMISLEGLKRRIRDIWTGQFFDKNKEGGQFSLYCKECIPPQNSSLPIVGLQNQPLLNHSQDNHEWQKEYEELLKEQGESGVHPLYADIDTIWKVKDRFMKIFDMAPEKEKERLVNEPLFPSSKKFSNEGITEPYYVQYVEKISDEKALASSNPLSYITFCGDFEALKKIDLYLKSDAYSEKGPYESTPMHCLISGFEKLVTSIDSYDGPLRCAEFFLKKEPNLASIQNKFGNKPITYAKKVLDILNSHLNHDWSGGYRVGSDDKYSLRVPILKSIIELLEKNKSPVQNNTSVQNKPFSQLST